MIDGGLGERRSVRERAPAKLNLLLQVGRRRRDGLHELCSLFAALELADDVTVSESAEGADTVVCPDVQGPNICAAALAAFRRAAPSSLPPLDVAVDKRIPVAGGLGGGSADAAAVLRAANRLAGWPLGEEVLRELAAGLGADVPSQVSPSHALVTGVGERIEPLALPPMWLVLAAARPGLATGAVYREADRLGATRERLDVDAARAAASRPLEELMLALENDLQRPALSLRPELAEAIEALRAAGALAALITGSGPTVFGVFEHPKAARRAAAQLPGAIVTGLLQSSPGPALA
jgi:4-diphosphocytidyl-2-C-methyl-D-erythritol kinase